MATRPSRRPRRADVAYTHSSATDDVSSKKPKFDHRNPSILAADAQEDDAILELDAINETGQQVKRSAVNLDGYDTDSSDDNFENRAADRKARAAHESDVQSQEKGAREKDKKLDDMFAEEEEVEDNDQDDADSAGAEERSDEKKKSVRFLDADEIEGQVASSKSGGHVSADFSLDSKSTDAVTREESSGSCSSESGDDYERDRLDSDIDEEVGAGAKRKHAPRLDAFNMRHEEEEGKFDEQGNYVRKATDPDAVHDKWLEGVSKKEMRKARDAHIKRQAELQQREREDDFQSPEDLLATLIPHLDRGESVLEALQRLGKGLPDKKRANSRQQRRRKQQTRDVTMADEEEGTKSVVDEKRNKISALTDAANKLFSRGHANIYDTSREALMRQFRQESGQDWLDTHTSVGDDEEKKDGDTVVDEWEFRWADGRENGRCHGPYSGQMMNAWKDAGYFRESAEFRRVADAHWSQSVEF